MSTSWLPTDRIRASAKSSSGSRGSAPACCSKSSRTSGKQFWGRHLWARGYFAVTTGTITDAMVKEYIAEQEGEPLQDDSRFRIDDSPKLPPSRR